MDNYFEGSRVRLMASFENENHNLTDPTTVTAKVEKPNGVKTTYIYLTDAELVRESQGIYHVDVDANLPKIWYFRFEGAGAVEAASQGSFMCIAAKPS